MIFSSYYQSIIIFGLFCHLILYDVFMTYHYPIITIVLCFNAFTGLIGSNMCNTFATSQSFSSMLYFLNWCSYITMHNDLSFCTISYALYSIIFFFLSISTFYLIFFLFLLFICFCVFFLTTITQLL
jgi:hypothetical protein